VKVSDQDGKISLIDNQDVVRLTVDDTGRIVTPSWDSGGGSIAPMPKSARVFAIGDSITAHGNTVTLANGTVAAGPLSYLAWATLLSNGKLRYGGVSGTGGYTISQVAATHLPVAVAQNPAFCVVLAGTNDLGNGATVAAMTSGLQAIYTTLRAASIIPVVCTPPPRSGDSGPNKNWAIQLNDWLYRYAAANGHPFVDFYGALVNTANGDYTAAYTSDNIHPTAAGAKVMGQAVATALSSYMASFAPYLNSVNTTSIGIDLFGGNALFLTDSNTDGLADGLAPASGSGATYAIPSASPLLGNYQSLTRGAVDTGVKEQVGFPLVAGDLVSVALPVAATVKSMGGSFDLRVMTTDGVTDLFSLVGFTEDVPAGSIWAGEFTIPSGLATPVGIAQLNVAAAATAVAKIAQPTIVDLTRVASPNLSLGGFEIHDGHRGAAIFGDGRTPETSYGVWRASTNRAQPLDFEVVGLTGWTKTDPAATLTATIDTAISKFGLSSLKMVNTTTNEDGFEAINISSPIAATKYAISVWVNSTVFNGAAVNSRGLYAFDTANPAGTEQTATVTGNTGGWTRLSVVVTTTASPGSIQVRLYAPNGTTYYDGLQVEALEIPTPYIGPYTGSRSSGLIKTDPSMVALMKASKGALVARVRPGWAATAGSVTTPRSVGKIYLDANNYIGCYFDPSNGAWTIEDRAAGTSVFSTKTATHSSGQPVTVAFKWSSAGSSISFDGSAWTTPVARPAGATWLPGAVYLASDEVTTHPLDGEMFWALLFDDPTNLDPAAAFLLSNIPVPTQAQVPSGTRGIIPATNSAYIVQ
jgi:lysophospholipase L1-like esterase